MKCARFRSDLCAHYQTVSTDWPGFGDRPRLRHDWGPEIYSDFLTYLVKTVLPPLHAVIAAGHAATFAPLHACADPGSFKRLVLIAPTWRGPLPTMMNGRRPLFDRICRLVDLPVIGPLLYWLKCESVCHSLHGGRTRLCRCSLAARPTVT